MQESLSPPIRKQTSISESINSALQVFAIKVDIMKLHRPRAKPATSSPPASTLPQAVPGWAPAFVFTFTFDGAVALGNGDGTSSVALAVASVERGVVIASTLELADQDLCGVTPAEDPAVPAARATGEPVGIAFVCVLIGTSSPSPIVAYVVHIELLGAGRALGVEP